MRCIRFIPLSCLFFGALFSPARAETPPLLAKAFAQWASGGDDLAFTQRTRILLEDGSTKEERLERYDPSLPDPQRWRLIEVDGKKATDEERQSWESKKNGKPRKKPIKPPGEYIDLEQAKLVKDTPELARFAVSFRAEAARLIDVEKVAVFVTVDKESGGLSHISATLREPLKVALGIVKITDIDLNVGIETPDDDPKTTSGDVQNGSTARVVLSKFGSPMEFRWSEFKRVKAYRPIRTAQALPTP